MYFFFKAKEPFIYQEESLFKRTSPWMESMENNSEYRIKRESMC